MGLHVMVTSPVPEELIGRIAAVPGVELLHDPSVLPPQRFPADTGGDPAFRPDEARWRELLGRAEVLYGVPFNSPERLEEALSHAPDVRWVQARVAGAGQQVQGLDLGDIVVTSVSGIHARSLAEFSLLGLLAFAQALPRLVADKAARHWPGAPEQIDEVGGSTVLIVGLGAIGVETARLCKALGMTVLGVRRSGPGTVDHVDEVHGPDALAELAARADALVVTLPLTDASRGLVDDAVLGALRPAAVVTNVGRGAVIDEEALVRRLRDGSLGGAALDVFDTEPLPADSPFWELENVIISPHGAARVRDEDERQLAVFTDNLRRFLAGEPLRNVVDTGHGY